MLQTILEFWYAHKVAILFVLSIFLGFFGTAEGPFEFDKKENGAVQGRKAARHMWSMIFVIIGTKFFLDAQFGWSIWISLPIALIIGMILSVFLGFLAMGLKYMIAYFKYASKITLKEVSRNIDNQVDKTLDRMEKRIEK